jgi:hypothetical protein
MGERAAFSVDEFCARNGISRAFLYLLWRRGCGPRFVQAGKRRLITREQETDWHRDNEHGGPADAAA